MNWEDEALCRQLDLDPELFFIVGKEENNEPQIAEAKSYCHQCPVRAECLGEALRKGRFGIWGGTTEEERRSLKPRPAAVA